MIPTVGDWRKSEINRLVRLLLQIRTDARVLGTTLKAGETADYPLEPGHHAYLVPASGAVEINGIRIDARDGAAITDETSLSVTVIEDAEIVLVDAA